MFLRQGCRRRRKSKRLYKGKRTKNPSVAAFVTVVYDFANSTHNKEMNNSWIDYSDMPPMTEEERKTAQLYRW